MGEGGYVREFVTDVCKPLLKDLVAKKIRVVTNAGGKFVIVIHSIWNTSSSRCYHRLRLVPRHESKGLQRRN